MRLLVLSAIFAMVVGSLLAEVKPALVVQVISTEDTPAYVAMMTKANTMIKAKTGFERLRQVWVGDQAGESSHGVFVVSQFPSAAAAAQMQEKKLTIVVYPEGTRTRTGDMLPFKKGPFVFAIGSGAPLIPCYVAGAFGIQPKGSIRVRKKPVTIVLGPPIPTAGLRPEDRDALSDRTREAMLELKKTS